MNANPSPRLTSLDAFRGLTIATMILVNNPGSWDHVYRPLAHADEQGWNGCTPTDLVFPFFVFIVGVAIPYSQSSKLRKLGREDGYALLPGILRRAALIFLCGLALGLIPTNWTNGVFGLGKLRIPGVLQRIAVCYFFAAVAAAFWGWRMQLAAAIAMLATYSVAMLAFGDLTEEGNLGAYIDRMVLGAHKYRSNFDPEGIFSTMPAIATAMFGTLTGLWLRSSRSAIERCAGLLAAGVVGAALGYVLDGALMPINKTIWSTSYTVYTAGLALLTLGFLFWVIDVHGYQRWCKPLVIFGSNALAVFMLSGIFGRLMGIKFTVDGVTTTTKGWIYQHVHLKLASGYHASLLYALTWIGCMFLITLALYRKKIFLRV